MGDQHPRGEFSGSRRRPLIPHLQNEVSNEPLDLGDVAISTGLPQTRPAK